MLEMCAKLSRDQFVHCNFEDYPEKLMYETNDRERLEGEAVINIGDRGLEPTKKCLDEAQRVALMSVCAW